MNKKGMQLQSAMFAVIAMSALIIAMGVIITSWSDAYQSGTTYDLNEYDNLDDVQVIIKGQQGALEPQDSSFSSEFENNIFKAGYGIITNIFEPFELVFGKYGMINSIANRYGLPPYIGQTLLGFMVVAVVMSIIAIVFRLPRRSA